MRWNSRHRRAGSAVAGLAAVAAAAALALAGGSADAYPILVYYPQITSATAVGGIMSVGVAADYAGTGPVTLTVGRTQDVLGSKVKQSSIGLPGPDGKWHLTVTGLDSGTSYWLRLDAPGTVWLSPVAVTTKRRKVVIDYTKLKVIDDGDAWPSGCGDFKFTMRTGYSGYRYYPEPDWTLCIDSGTTAAIDPGDDVMSFRHWETANWPSDFLREEFYAWDDDVDTVFQDNPYQNCGSDTFLSPTCGDLGYVHRNLDLKPAGTRAISLEAWGGNIDGNSVDVIAYGTVTVTYY